jgi:hypothetical protein
MDCETETGTDVLKCILALLFSFADIAANAAGRSYPVRCYLLWLLRRGEPYAWRCVMRECGIAPGDRRLRRIPLRMVICNSPADALRLAETYRALARALQKQLRLEDRLTRRLSHPDHDRIDLDWGKLAWLTPFASFPSVRGELALPDLDFTIAPRLDTS